VNRKKFKYEDYNKEEASIDATRFFIVYEGKVKEPNYFEAFNEKFMDPKKAIICHILEENTGIEGNTPLKIKERVEEFIKNPPKNILITPSTDDKFRFVLDTDKHPFTQIQELKDYSDSLTNSEIFISNYCFEVWLWAHIKDLNKITAINSKKLKTELGTIQKLNYPHEFIDIKLIRQAIERCKTSDNENSNFIPEEKNSKVYLLIEELLSHSFINLGTSSEEIN
jgi:hypothetical protein